MGHLLRILAVACAFVALVAFSLSSGQARPAAAHPLGNFTINHYDRISVSDHGIELYSVLDMAEIPAFRERQQIDANSDGTIDAQESETYALDKIASMQPLLSLRLDGKQATLTPVSHELRFPPGQGGLPLLRLTVTYAAYGSAEATSQHTIEFDDGNDADRIGWREIVVRSDGGARISDSSVPSQDVSRELTAYPTDALSSPLDVRTARAAFDIEAGAAADPAGTRSTAAVRGNSDAPLARFASLISKEHLSAGVIVLALLAAMGFGALHALSPGHGKTIVAAYLVGSKGTGRHAVILGLTVTLTHTSSVYAIGFIALSLSQFILPERLYPWLTVASGALITAMGLALLIGRLRASGALAAMRARVTAIASPASAPLVASVEGGGVLLSVAGASSREQHVHAHPSSSHDGGGAGHQHGFGPAHMHAAADEGDPVTLRRLFGLGVFGGLLPCPSAIVVMLSAVSLHRVGFGLLLIVAFSLGLATVLTSIGFVVVYGQRLIERLPFLRPVMQSDRGNAAALAVRAFPIVTAAAVVAAGLLLTFPALMNV